jgi:hypothetical protein
VRRCRWSCVGGGDVLTFVAAVRKLQLSREPVIAERASPHSSNSIAIGVHACEPHCSSCPSLVTFLVEVDTLCDSRALPASRVGLCYYVYAAQLQAAALYCDGVSEQTAG